MTGVLALPSPYGGDHSLYVKTDSSVWGTGRNYSGQLGDGTTLQSTSLKKLMTGVKAVTNTSGHSFFLKTDNTVWGTGRNSSGQLGDGTTISKITPVQLMSDVQSIACSNRISFFLKIDRTVWATGNHSYGAIGDGVAPPNFIPVRAFTAALSVPANVSLSGLTISSGALSPAFDSATINYTASVANTVSSLTLSPTAADSMATVQVNDTPVASGSTSNAIPLTVGSNIINVLVTAQDGTTRQSYSITVTVLAPPIITAQPVAATANQGASVSFSVTATGTNLSYQWKMNGANLAGEAGDTLSLNNLQGTQAGSYSVVVSNSAGSVTSNAAVLTVLGITSDLERLTLNVGTSMSYRVTASPAPTTYAAKSLPVGLKINAKTGVIFGKPKKAGEYTVTLQALRKGGATLTAVKTFRILQAPTFKLPAKVKVTRNKAFRSAPKVSAFPSASFSVVSGTLPEGIALNPTTGQISGITGTVKGNYAVTIRGSNEAGKTDVKTVLVVK
jgi:hypothetical protein